MPEKVDSKETDVSKNAPNAVLSKEELTDEDKHLKEELDVLVSVLKEGNQALSRNALETLRNLIRASTTSMTSVPKPLKFMRDHYRTMMDVHTSMPNDEVKKFCADIISVLAMTSSSEGSLDCLRYRLIGSMEPVSAWGHEYVRHLTMEIVAKWNSLETTATTYSVEIENLMKIVDQIIPYQMTHNAEVEACDLLVEIEKLDYIIQYVDVDNQPRVCLYLLSLGPFALEEEYEKLLAVCQQIYLKFDKRVDALRCAIMMNRVSDIKRIFLETKNLLVQKQMAFILARHHIFLELDDNTPFLSEINQLMSNSMLSQYFLGLARDLDVLDPKTPDDIYKTHLEPTRSSFTSQTQVDSYRQNLASTLTNGFVNIGFCADKLLGDDGNQWFHKHKDYGTLVAAASMGLIHRWDVSGGLAAVDKYLYSDDEYIRGGSLLAVGVISSGVYDECDPAGALLSEYINKDKLPLRIGSILGLGLAYTNSKRDSVQTNIVKPLLDVLSDPKSSSEVLAVTGLSLGFICVGTGNQEVSQAIWSVLLDKTEVELKDNNYRFLILGAALIFLGKQQYAEAFVESMKVLKEPFGSMASTLVEIAAYAGSGNVLKIQHLLHICSEHHDSVQDDKKNKKDGDAEKDKDTSKPDLSFQQAVAVLGIALIAMGEEIGSNMSFRLFGHLPRYCELPIRRAVPLAMGLSSVSNCQLNIMEALSKFSHDSDQETSSNAIFALGLIGAGTNNARLAAMLRQLAAYYQREPSQLMLVRIAQGMIHMGKGTMTLNPYHSDRLLLNPAALAGLFTICFAFLDVKNTILNRQSYLFYCLVPAIYPRMLVTLEEIEQEPMASESSCKALKQVNTNVRVGQAVDVVGQAGKPKTITGFQTSSTPVLLAHGERAELASDDYTAVTTALEGFVILEKLKK